MKAHVLATAFITCGLLGAPAMAQQSNNNSDQLTYSIQQRLQQEGIYHGNLDGVWGPNTQQAIDQFQQKNGRRASGNLTLGTLEALHISPNTPIPMSGGQEQSSNQNQFGQQENQGQSNWQGRGCGPSNQGCNQNYNPNHGSYGQNQYNPNQQQYGQNQDNSHNGYNNPNQNRLGNR